MAKWKKLYDRFLNKMHTYKVDVLTEALAHYGYHRQGGGGLPPDRERFFNEGRNKYIYIHNPTGTDMVKATMREEIVKSLEADKGKKESMYDVLIYKGYVGSIEISLEDGCLYGKILGIRDLVLYEGNTLTELENDFRAAVDVYLLDRG